MAACAWGLGGLGHLSAERIRAELVKLLVAPRAADAVVAMGDIGLATRLLFGREIGTQVHNCRNQEANIEIQPLGD